MGDIYCGALASSDYLAHHGVKGMRWGVRRYQREDGSLTSAGKKQKLKNEHKNEAEKKRGSLKGAGHRALGKVYELNEKAYDKLGNKTLASMNRAAKEQQLKKANAADAASEASRQNRSNTIKNAGHKALGKVYELNEKAYDKLGNKTLASMNRAAKEEQYKKAGISTSPSKTNKTSTKESNNTSTSSARDVGKNIKARAKGAAANIAKAAIDNSTAAELHRRETVHEKGFISSIKDNYKAAKNQKTISGKLSEMVGSGAAKRDALNAADYKRRLAKTYLSEKKRANLEREARNLEREAEFHDKVNKEVSKGGLHGVGTIVKESVRFTSSYGKIPYEKANGKMITKGQHELETKLKRVITDKALEIGARALVGAADNHMKKKYG